MVLRAKSTTKLYICSLKLPCNVIASTVPKKKTGGYAQLRPQRNTKPSSVSKKQRAINTVIEKLGGLVKATEMVGTFINLEKGIKTPGCVHADGDGFLAALIQQGFSQYELRSYFNVGGYLVGRLCEEVKNPGLRQRRFTTHVPKHAFTEEDKQRVKDHVKTWDPELEEGFPRQHRRQQRFFRTED